jgi:hypothetical protein
VSARAEDLLGPRARALLARVEFRLALRTFLASALLSLAAFLVIL